MTSAARVVFMSSADYGIVMPRRVSYSTYTFHDDVVYATIRSGARLLLFYATAKPRRHFGGTTRSRGRAAEVSPRSTCGVREQERVPASRMHAFEAFVTLSSLLFVELAYGTMHGTQKTE